MEKYIKQLIEDLKVAQKQVPRETGVEIPSDVDECVKGAYEYQYGPMHKLEDLVGIKKDELPVPEKLTKKQKQLLTKEILEM